MPHGKFRVILGFYVISNYIDWETDMERAEPLEMLLPGTWHLTFQQDVEDSTGAGAYTFKLAGSFNAHVRDLYSGQATWHGYWHIESARLHLQAQAVSSRCNSCLGGGTAYEWAVELEQVADDVFTGVLRRDHDAQPVIFRRA
jgi:hypothetical protein